MSPPLGPPRPVLVLPGFVSGDSATIALRLFLRSIGHRPHGWGLGLNVGASHHIAEGVDRTLRNLYHEHGEPIDIVGWSAGGILGRVLASHRSEMVRQVISLGSPINMQSHQTNIGHLQRFFARFFLEPPRRFDLDRVPVPSTTVWTRSDGVVPGLACRQTIRREAEVVEVRGSHTGLGANGAVFYLVADRLALPRGDWHPFDPPDRLRRLYPTIENERTGPADGLVPAGPFRPKEA
ncbi:MAG: alpha/beta hydrolase [Acidimicrobiales bacterium]